MPSHNTDGIAINWAAVPNDAPILNHVLYQKWSVQTIASVTADPSALKTDLGAAVLNNDTTEIVAYLSTLLRAAALIGS